MPENHLYEYAVLRLVPRVEREEFINIGVVLYCPSKAFLAAETYLHAHKIKAFAPDLDVVELEQYLTKFHHICAGNSQGGPIATLHLASRFRWLVATRSTIVQPSKIHPGLCQDPQQTLNKLMNELVK